ncbi:hypothetical protein Ddc_13696 [Ditylenchus destructor]|nr:hypothetical protein Ddc_13696 [Ditylenchus destructor]
MTQLPPLPSPNLRNSAFTAHGKQTAERKTNGESPLSPLKKLKSKSGGGGHSSAKNNLRYARLKRAILRGNIQDRQPNKPLPTVIIHEHATEARAPLRREDWAVVDRHDVLCPLVVCSSFGIQRRN